MTRDPSVPSGPSRCPNCNSPLSPQMKFCESCGAKIETVPVCRNCGAPLPAGVKFCEECGAPRDTPATPSPAPAPVAPPVMEKAEPVIPAVPPAAPVTVPDMPATVPVPPAAPPKKEGGEPEPERVVPAPAKPATPPSKNTLVIAGVIGALVLVAAVVFVVLPMFSGPGGAPAAGSSSMSSTGPAAGAAAAGTTSAASGQTPGPTQTLPSAYTLSFQVDKDVISGDVTVTVTGPSRSVVKNIQVRLTRADGQVITKDIIPNQKINEVTLPGTRNSERVEVTVLFYTGEQYKVIDKIAQFNKRT